MAWSVLLGLWRAADRSPCSIKLKVPKLCQDSAISLILSLSLSLVLANIGVGSKICLGLLV